MIRSAKRRVALPTWILVAVCTLAGFGCTEEPEEVATPPGRLALRLVDANGDPLSAQVAIDRMAAGSEAEPLELGEDPLRAFTIETLGYFPRSRERMRQWFFMDGGRPRDVFGELALEVPEGDYRVRVAKGIEYSPHDETLRVRSGETTVHVFRVQRFVDMPSRGWWSGDTHFHMARPDRAADERILRVADARDLHVMNAIAMGDRSNVYFPQYAFGREGTSFSRDFERMIAVGQEDPRTHDLGHVLALDIAAHERDPDSYVLYDGVLERLREAGARVGFAHVRGAVREEQGSLGADHTFNVDLGLSLAVPAGLVDFVEIERPGPRQQIHHDFLNLGYRLPVTAGSDYPFANAPVGGQRVYVDIGADEKLSPDRWFDALVAGRTFITQGPLVEFEIDGEGPGAVLAREAGDRVRVQARALGHRSLGAPLRLDLVRFGRIVETQVAPEREGEGDEARALESLSAVWEIEVEGSAWFSLRAEADNGAAAWTSPIYIEVGGRPAVDLENVDAILARRLRRLREFLPKLSARYLEQRAEAVLGADDLTSWKRSMQLESVLALQHNRQELTARIVRGIMAFEEMRERYAELASDEPEDGPTSEEAHDEGALDGAAAR